MIHKYHARLDLMTSAAEAPVRTGPVCACCRFGCGGRALMRIVNVISFLVCDLGSINLTHVGLLISE